MITPTPRSSTAASPSGSPQPIPPIADAYTSMADFWTALREHEQGIRPGSIWDTYEAGERRIVECALAQAFESPSAVAICSGMAAILNALMGAALATSASFELPRYSGYFEILDLFQGVLGPLTTSTSDSGVRLMEPVSNEPGLAVNLAALSATPAAAIVVDNSLFSHSVPWAEWRRRTNSPLLVVESIPKFLHRRVSGGVVYGEHELVEAVRTTARRTGTLLPRVSCQALARESYAGIRDRLDIHAANADTFAARLQATRPDLIVRRPHAIARGAGLSTACSSVVIAVYPDGVSSERDFEEWCSRAGALADRPMVRAGYGWDQTYGRAYGADQLNTAAGTPYVRFSIGIEPLADVERLAAAYPSNGEGDK